MLYLEDYLEMIEHLPQELRDRFTEIRELDLQVQNTSDKLDERVRTFFRDAKKMKQGDRDIEFELIRKEFYKTLEDADEKVHQANQMYDLVERYLRRLDQELHKFKMELEADNAGITEVLEKRSLELDQQLRERDLSSQKENRYAGNIIKTEKKSERKSSIERGHASGTSTPTLSYSLGHIAGGNMIAAAASQAIAATQQMQQGRRTASLKASYEAINMGVHTHEFSVGREALLANAELHQAAQQAYIATAGSSSMVEQKRNKRKSQHTQNQDLVIQPVAEIIDDGQLMETGAEIDYANYDANEPRYCLCNQVSYGDMIACDNEDCTIEWFHYGCVGITGTPKGKWFCPQCSQSMKRRGNRR